MKLNIDFLQTGGVPLTNDLMATIMEAIQIYDVLGAFAGHKTILSGCDPVNGSLTSVNPGIVAINDEVLYFEGGNISANVFIQEDSYHETFEDQTDNVLIRRKIVKFGNGVLPNLFPWSEFTRLQTLKDVQISLAGKANQSQVDDHETRIQLLELKTAPIQNGGIVWAWFRPVSEIPAGWKEALNIRGKTIVGLDPNDPDFSTLGSYFGTKKHLLTIAELPSHDHPTAEYAGPPLPGSTSNHITAATNGPATPRTGKTGGDQAHNNVQPSIIAPFIEPNFQ